MTDVGIVKLIKGCSQLRTINIACCYQLTDASLAAIGETCKGLTSIDMSRNRNISYIGIARDAVNSRLSLFGNAIS